MTKQNIYVGISLAIVVFIIVFCSLSLSIVNSEVTIRDINNADTAYCSLLNMTTKDILVSSFGGSQVETICSDSNSHIRKIDRSTEPYRKLSLCYYLGFCKETWKIVGYDNK